MKRRILVLFVLLYTVLFAPYTTAKSIAADEIPGPIIVYAIPQSLC